MEFSSAVSLYILECCTSPQRLYPTKIAPSWIPDSGMGLFAAGMLSRGEIVGKYFGEVMDTKRALRTKDKSYLMRLGEQVFSENLLTRPLDCDELAFLHQCYVDSRNTWTCHPRFINDCRNTEMYNVEFIKSPQEKCAWVKAIRDIRDGEELYVDYGKWYWASVRPIRVTKRFIQEKIDALGSDESTNNEYGRLRAGQLEEIDQNRQVDGPFKAIVDETF